MSNFDSNQSSFSKIAFNIYGGLNSGSTPEAKALPNTKYRENTRERFINEIVGRPKILYNCEKDVSCITELNYSLKNVVANYDDDPSCHIVLGGKNYLRLLALNSEQTLVLKEVDILEQIGKSYRKFLQGGRLSNVSCLKARHDIIACELSTGQFAVCKIQNSGKANLMHVYADHKRPINSIDFVPVSSGFNDTSPFQIISGSQDGTIKLWDMRSSSVKPALTIKSGSHTEPVRACEVSPHSTVRNKLNILSVHDSGALYKHDVRSPSGTGSLSVAAERKWNFHTGPALSLDIHPEAEFVMTGGRDKKICVFDYSEAASSANKLNPDIILNSFGPVSKVRWCPYDNNESGKIESTLESEGFNGDDKSVFEKDINSSLPHSSKSSSLYNYNIACSFLHEDPTIAIYDLKRKHIPKYILQSQTNKPFQNFIWADNPVKLKTLWTITKDNLFASYTLDACEADDYIYSPLDNLPKVAMAWNYGMDTLCFVAQEKEEYESTFQQDYQSNQTECQLSTGDKESALPGEKTSHASSFVESSGENGARRFFIPGEEQHSVYDYQSGVGSIPVASNSNLSTSSSLLSSYARPNIFRSMTAGSFASFTKRLSSKRFDGDSESDIAFQGQSSKFPGRHFSESAQKSPFSNNSATTNAKEKKNALVSYASPYVFTLDMGFPRSNEHTFKLLASNYLIFVPDGFSLTNVCLYNANVAAMANRFRESQTWKIVAISVEDSNSWSAGKGDNAQFPAVSENDNERKSSISETDNLVGSYNTMSTLTTNNGRSSSFGQGNSFDSALVIKEKQGFKMSQLPEAWDEGENSASAIEEGETTQKNEDPIELVSQEVSSHGYNNLKKTEGDPSNPSPMTKTGESTPANGEFSRKTNLPLRRPHNRQSENFRKLDNEKVISSSEMSSHRRYSPFSAFGSPASPTSLKQTPMSPESRNMSSNNVTTNRVQQGRYNVIGLDQNSPSNAVDPVRGFRTQPGKTEKDDSAAREFDKDESLYNERSGKGKESFSSPNNKKTSKSALSNVLGKTASKDENPLNKPWSLNNLLREVLNYSVVEGEIIFCATLTILFYDYTKGNGYCIFTREQCLDWISLYIELLQKRKLFSNAINVINNVPDDLKDDIVNLTIKDVDLQFKCSWCYSALNNESSMKRAKKVGHTENWFCDNCKRRQMNCIYCNEPCLGLNVVISLHCGHRGHFGCLREWFVEEENIECPGGCDYTIF